MHRLASDHGLFGWAKNTSSGLVLELEGESPAIESFLHGVRNDAPPLSNVESVSVTELMGLAGYQSFQIIPSTREDRIDTLVSPDISICDECRCELFNPDDRRYRYPFINCTNCGPRFTMIRGIPYDRAKTTMDRFPMCPECMAEYGDIKNRRYHAQPNCCPRCGPKLFFLDSKGNEGTKDPIEEALNYLKEGKTVAIKGLGGIHLACIVDEETVRRLRRLKRRDERPLAIMCKDMMAVEKLCVISPEERRRLESPAQPIVLLGKRKSGLDYISENGYIGVMLPYTPVHCLLMEGGMDCLVMTSANLSDLPVLYENMEAVQKLSGVADGFLLNDRDIYTRCDDSVLRVFEGRDYFIRRSRGFVPLLIKTGSALDGIFSCGAEQKASFGISKGEYFFLSGHIGDLKNEEALDHYTAQAAHTERLFGMKVKKIACDLHPDYMSTDYAQKRAKDENIPLLRVQHHHAHLASCMADNGVKSDCLGVIWDGSGYGEDGTTWGGEILFGGYSGYRRLGTIRPITLPGGDSAVFDIRRLGFSMMRDAQLPGYGDIMGGDADTMEAMMRAKTNCPEATSMGRLFDGVSAILGIKRTASYEGQGAILLESTAYADGSMYDISFDHLGSLAVFDQRPMIRQLVKDLSCGIPVCVVAGKFMNTLVEMAAASCQAAAREIGIYDVCLSGGVFQNMYILKKLCVKLASRGFTVYTHSRVSCTDEGIALGQAVVAYGGGQ